MLKFNPNNWYNFSKPLVLLGLFMLFAKSVAQDLPPIQYFSPKQYHAENQNWEITQCKSKHIYVANSKGLLEFNGSEWILYSSPNQTIIRSVNVVSDKVYTGSYMEFGYWTRTDVGDLKYTSLSKKISSTLLEDEQFWKITHLDDWILFQSLSRIYIYNTKTDKFNITESKAGIIKMFKVDNSIYYQDRIEGLLKLENGQPKVILQSNYFKNKIIAGVYTLKNNLLVVTQNHGIVTIKNNTVQDWNANLNSQLKDYRIYSSLQLNDDSLILGTISNGIIQIDANGNIFQKISQANGLGNNTVLSIFQDIESNIWLALDNGINCVNINSPFRIFNDDHGVLGTVYTSLIYDNTLYLGTNQGLFYKKSDQTAFKPVVNTNGQVWSLKIIDNQLFCGHNSGTFIINNNVANRIASVEGTWDIKTISDNPNLLIQGNYNGLNILEKKAGFWQFRNKIEGFNNSSRFFVFSKKDEILVNHEYKGVFKIKIDSDYRTTTQISKIETLEKGLFSSLTTSNNTLYYATDKGVFKKHLEDNTFVKDTVLSKIYKTQGYSSGKIITDQANNALWLITKKGINYVSPGKLSTTPDISFIALPSSLREGLSGYESIFNLKPNLYLFGTSKGYITLNLSKIKPKTYQVEINTINKTPLQKSKQLISLKDEIIFKNKENNIEIKYSVAEYDKYLEAEYSHKLDGLYNDWSSWNTNAEVLYKNLPYGEYTFIVKARVGGVEVTNQDSFTFTIGKPWFLSNIMIMVYCVIGFISILLINYFYKLYYRKQKEKLVLKSKRELELKDLETKQQLMALNNDKLRQEIDNKNRELAISTMSLIKKNEFLNTIKSELNEKVESANLKSVIRIIDKNINNKDDWNLFEEAFNNADKDFLKKVKTKHPALTSNDLRLCAYLRLNLSSKEIAPLLNISPRSVEVKRYRLRKKMELEHDVNLTDYILSI